MILLIHESSDQFRKLLLDKLLLEKRVDLFCARLGQCEAILDLVLHITYYLKNKCRFILSFVIPIGCSINTTDLSTHFSCRSIYSNFLSWKVTVIIRTKTKNKSRTFLVITWLGCPWTSAYYLYFRSPVPNQTSIKKKINNRHQITH